LRFAGLRRIGHAERIVENGSLSTPLVVAASMPTPAAPSPRSRSTCVKAPPKEWPMITGGRSRPRMMPSQWSMTVAALSGAIGDGSRRSSSTLLPSRPGRAGARTRKPRLS
jgi:hypothetical protein